MADKNVKVPLPGVPEPVDGVVVDVEEATERWSEIKLVDGTSVRIKPVVLQVVRADSFDADGNPVYVVRASQVMTVDAPEALRKK